MDGNLILNREDEYAKGYVQLNISGGKSFNNGIQLKAGIDNLGNYRNEQYITNQAGITFFFNIACQFFNNKKQ